MASSSKKGNSYKVNPSVSEFNKPTNDAEVLKFFNDNIDKKRMEINEQLNQSGKYPTVISNMKGGGSKKSNGGK